MHINIPTQLPSIMDIECFEYDYYNDVRELYKTLDIHDEILTLNQSNLQKIIDYFNSTDNIEKTCLNFLKEYGIDSFATSNDLFITGYHTNDSRYLYNVNLSQSVHIHNKKIVDFIDKSKKDFFAFVTLSDKNKTKTSYSLINSESVEIIRIRYDKVNNLFLLGLKLKYSLKNFDTKHFEYYKNDNVYFSADIDNYGVMNVTIQKTYTNTIEDINNEQV